MTNPVVSWLVSLIISELANARMPMDKAGAEVVTAMTYDRTIAATTAAATSVAKEAAAIAR
jgi:hypothetical protein